MQAIKKVNGWEVIEHIVLMSSEGHTVSRFSATPNYGTNWKMHKTGKWTLFAPVAGVTCMHTPFVTFDEAVNYAEKFSAPTMSYGD